MTIPNSVELNEVPMQTEFRAIVHSEYGAPAKVLKIAKRQLKESFKNCEAPIKERRAWS